MKRLAYLAPEIGSLTSTFVYREIRALEARGFSVAPFGTRAPHDPVTSAEAQPLRERSVYLYALGSKTLSRRAVGAFLREPRRALRALATALRDAACASVPSPTDRAKVLVHVAMGAAFADYLLEAEIEHVHSHFAHVPTAVAMYAAMIAGIPFSFTCHANDIFQRPTSLKEKTARAHFVSCISEFNVDYLARLGCDRSRLRVIRCGLDPREYASREPRAVAVPLAVFSAARLVPKKGLNDLVSAIAGLVRDGVPVVLSIAGDGPERPSLERLISELEVQENVRLLGSLPQEEVRQRLEAADVFALPCVVDAHGDQDGIPVALMEAMAIGVPVVSTTVSGIPELIVHELTGLLVPPHDPAALADALRTLATQPGLREAIVARAREHVVSEFSSGLNADRLAEGFCRRSGETP